MEIMSTPATAATTNTQKELRLYATSPSDYQSNNTATSASSLTANQGTTNGARSPFQREVREWQRIDPDTGALFSGRLEADRWISGPLNSYGKIYDSQNITQPNGTQQTQRKQLEVLQTCTAGGAAMQVIRSQTIQTSSSRWSSPPSSARASPSPPSLSMQLSSAATRAPKVKNIKLNKQQTHKRTSTTTSTSTSTSTSTTTKTATKSNTRPNATHSNNNSTSSLFKVTNGINQYHNHSKKNHTSTTSTSNKHSSSINSSSTTCSPRSATNSANGHNINGIRCNWPYSGVRENSSTLEICDNDHDNVHHHDNDYIVDHASSIAGDDDDINNVGNGNIVDIVDIIYADDENHSIHDNNDSISERNNVDNSVDVSCLNRLSKSSSSFLKHLKKLSTNNYKNDLSRVNNDDDDVNDDRRYNDDDDDDDDFGRMDNGHSSSNSSLNSHSGGGNSYRNTSNQLFLLDTAPSLKLSNLMKSSSSISNSSNNSTTATTPTTPPITMNLNTTNTALSSSMNTHNNRASKISLHAIVGNNNNNNSNTKNNKTNNINNTGNNNGVSDHTASLTPSATHTATATGTALTTTTTAQARPSWQQPSILRQNNNGHNYSNSNTNPKLNRTHSTSAAATASTSQQSSSHFAKMRVGDNNCFGGNGGGGGVGGSSSNNSSSDESRPYSIAATNVAVDLRHRRHQSPTSAFHMKLQKNDRLTPTQSQQRHNRVDLESFRHYNNNNDNNNRHIKRLDINDTYVADTPASLNSPNAVHDDDDDDGIRLSTRHLRRQQTPTDTKHHIAATSLQRSRSISTDDLTTEWDINGDGDNEEPAEWRRVSKLRRSFQSSSKPQHSPTTSPRRPLDLPTNSVSVSRIRAELESGRRLNTVMKNNHVDLAALSTILNGPSSNNKSPSPPPSQSSSKSSFLTAESLKEIRGRLKKLSDESLYKEDFILNQQTVNQLPEQELIEVQATTTMRRSKENSPINLSSINANRVDSPKYSPKHTTNSLESRLKFKETNPLEWHMRRKSYGFEKMATPDKSMVRMDASTDSGLGRSGELQNWSPTSETSSTSAASRNSTIIHFGENNNRRTSSVTRRYRPQKSYEGCEESSQDNDEMALNKRHSIAVDESQYVRENGKQTTQVRLNGFYNKSGDGKHLIHSAEMSNATTTSTFSQKGGGQQKRVEFCKTEVHFATESGRVNIVETDSKPPPTNNFRRRRSRSSSVGPLQSLVKSATVVSTTTNSSCLTPSTSTTVVVKPVTLFGDDSPRSKTKETSSGAAFLRTPLFGGSPEPKDLAKIVTVTVPDPFGLLESSRSSYASTSTTDTTDYETDEMTSLRGILKNKPAKPKPYVLGENIEKPDELWGIQLKPVKETSGDSSGRVKGDSPPLMLTTAQQRSVAERIRLVEQLEHQNQQQDSSSSLNANGFSTKINVSLGALNEQSLVGLTKQPWEENGRPIQILTQQRRLNAQEMLLQDLKDNQRILDEGLKSTTSIIKSMRSTNEFDEAMRRLSIASMEAAVNEESTPTENTQESLQTSNDFNENVKDIKRLQLNKNKNVSSTSSRISQTSLQKPSSRDTSIDSGADTSSTSIAHKDSQPGHNQFPINKQLQRLRLIFDKATASSQSEEDSADEEVKSYFRHRNDSDSGGGTQESSSYEDDQYLEYSSNSHNNKLKANKIIWRIDMNDCVEGRKAEELTDLPISNVMSIKLHSPHATTTQASTAVKLVSPIAKTRTITSYQEPSTTSKTYNTTTANTIKSNTSYHQSSPAATKESLKLVKDIRGARQLRDHELSYFGIPINKSESDSIKTTKLQSNSLTTNENSNQNSLSITRKVCEDSPHFNDNEESNRNNNNQFQWQLDNNKPDLLKHSPIKPELVSRRPRTTNDRKSLKTKTKLEEDDEEHFYENIANEIMPIFKVKDAATLTENYDRKMDLKRDAMILSEMTKSADQSLKELSDEAALKDRKRRSLQRRNPKPLETIAEKSNPEKILPSDNGSVKISRGTFASEAKKTSRHSTPSPTHLSASRVRTSSQSSVESCPRARSRSLSSEKEYENQKKSVPKKPTRSINMAAKQKSSLKPLAQIRSSSLDSHRSYHSQYSSGEEQQQQQQQHLRHSFRRPDRSRAKTKRLTTTNASPSYRQDANKQHLENSAKSVDTPESKRSFSTTHSSTHRERVECSKNCSSGPITPSNTPPAHRRRQTSTSATNSPLALQRSKPGSGGSGRHVRDDSRDSHEIKRSSATGGSGRSTSERHERQESNSKNTSSRSRREEERIHATTRSDEKEKVKPSKSKAHSSRSTCHAQRHEKSSSMPTTTAAISSDQHAANNSGCTRDVKHKSFSSQSSASASTAAATDYTTHSKNAQATKHQQHHSHSRMTTATTSSKERSRDRHQTRSSSKREEEPHGSNHMHGLKSAIIKTTTKLRDKSRARKDKLKN